VKVTARSTGLCALWLVDVAAARRGRAVTERRWWVGRQRAHCRL